MSAAVADTHAVIWYLSNSESLSSKAVAAFEDAYKSGDKIYISAITLVEIIYLVEKGKLPQLAQEGFIQALEQPDSFFVLAPLNFEVAVEIQNVSRKFVADMPDRIIAATARHLDLPLITRDRKIAKSAIETIW
jgi:PIN domain nuclease of toxin-antitoxin system